MGSQESLLHFFCSGRNGDISCGTALLKDLHVVNCRVAVEIVLMAVEGFGEFVKVGIERIEPAGASKSIPVALSNNVSAGADRGEICGNNSVVTRKNRGDAEAAQCGDELLCGARVLLEKLHGDWSLEAAHVAHQLPVLVGGLDDPVPDRLIGVARVADGLIEDEVHAALDQDSVGATQSEDVDLMLPALLVPVRSGVAVHVFVERVTPGIEGWLLDGSAGRRQNQVAWPELKTIRRHLKVCHVLQVPVDSV